MRIAYFTESLPPLTDGVARTYTWLASHLKRQAVGFRFYSPCDPGERDPWHGAIKAVPYFQLPIYSYYRVGLPWGQGLAGDLDRFKPDLVQVAAPTPLGLAGQAYALKRGVPLVSSYHTHFARYLPYYGLSALAPSGWAFLRWFHNRGLRTYVPSQSAAAELRAHGFERVALWERGLDASRFSPGYRSQAERRRWAKPSEALLLYVGRLVADKDLRILAGALEQLRAQGRRVRCVFAGDGPLKAELQARLPLDHFPGFVRGDPLSQLYASADLFAFPSTNETFGNVVLEAMASGLPVVAAAAGGPADLVQAGKNGLLAAPKDAGDLAAMLAKALARPALQRRLRTGGLATAHRFDWQRVHGRLVADYRRLLVGF